jgi:hypothetical protein
MPPLILRHIAAVISFEDVLRHFTLRQLVLSDITRYAR